MQRRQVRPAESTTEPGPPYIGYEATTTAGERPCPGKGQTRFRHRIPLPPVLVGTTFDRLPLYGPYNKYQFNMSIYLFLNNTFFPRYRSISYYLSRMCTTNLSERRLVNIIMWFQNVILHNFRRAAFARSSRRPMNQSTTDDASVTEPSGDRGVRKNWSLILLFTVLSIVGIALSTGLLNLGIVDTEQTATGDVAVPMYVYLYASLGALGYIFTKLMSHLEKYDDATELNRLIKLTLRIPVAWILGSGTYLLANVMLPASAPNTAQFTAGIAFLVGLYVNVTMRSLGSLADRLLGRGKSS